MIPNLSTNIISPKPILIKSLAIAEPAAPAPDITILTSFLSFFTIFDAFFKAAAVTIAVPCWSS